MEIERITYLYKKYQLKELSQSEQMEWNELVDSPELTEALRSNTYPEWDELTEADFLSMNQEVSEEILSGILAQPQERSKAFKLWPRIAVAAAIATIIFGTGLFFFNKQTATPSGQDITQDIAPGKSGATLTLASGKKVRLTEASDGKLAEESGVVITKLASGQLKYEIKGKSSDINKINTLSTANGETYQVRLPDGSLVVLNAASSLEYPANFTALKERRVKLTGEGYFQVSKDKAHPFVVESRGQEVEVLGTHFNLNTYADEPAISTALLEGSVKITAGNRQAILKPGFLAQNEGGNIKVSAANVENITDWKDGEFNLDGVDFKAAMRKIARWYDVEVIFDSSLSSDIISGGWISRNAKLSAILEGIERTGQVHFKLEGRKLYVTR